MLLQFMCLILCWLLWALAAAGALALGIPSGLVPPVGAAGVLQMNPPLIIPVARDPLKVPPAPAGFLWVPAPLTQKQVESADKRDAVYRSQNPPLWYPHSEILVDVNTRIPVVPARIR